MYLRLEVLIVDDVLDDAIVLDFCATFAHNFLHEVGDDVVVHLHSNILLDDAWFLGVGCLDLLVQDKTPKVHVGVIDRNCCIFLLVCFPDLVRAKVLDVGEEALVVEFQFLNLKGVSRELRKTMVLRHKRLELKLWLVLLVWVMLLVMSFEKLKVVSHPSLLC